jgi:hypothetical protein
LFPDVAVVNTKELLDIHEKEAMEIHGGLIARWLLFYHYLKKMK